MTDPDGDRGVNAWMEAIDGVAYLVDEDGLIVAVGRTRWDLFSTANGAAQLTAAAMVGQNLFSEISGQELRRYYKACHKAALRGEDGVVAFEYRCDAPDTRRTMRMAISRLALEGGPVRLLYQSQVLSSVSRPWMTLFEAERLLEAMRGDSALPIVTMCGICARLAWPVDGASTTWIEADAYYQQGGPSDVRVSHGVCPACASPEFSGD